MHEKSLNAIKDEEGNINEQIFNEFFKWNLYEKNQNSNEKIVKNINESLINSKNFINIKEIPEIENPKNIINYCWQNPLFNKQRKDKKRTSFGLSSRS